MEQLKAEIRLLQIILTKDIQQHNALYLKLKEDPLKEREIKEELQVIQKRIVKTNEEQKLCLCQLRKELDLNGGHIFNFNLYKIKAVQVESKERRRKDLHLPAKVVNTPTVSNPPSLSPSPTPSSCSDVSDDSLDFDEVTPSQLPIPLPRARPKLLPNDPPSFYATARRDLKPKIKKLAKLPCDEEVFKDIPMYDDPPPSPEPTDETQVKAKYMKALGLIPKEMLSEILNKKVERKRRSTANNNPHFVYNNDWEIPVWKRSRTYLSPHKVQRVDPVRKSKVEEQIEGVKMSILKHLKNEPYTAEEKNTKSPSRSCSVCHAAGPLYTCKDCNNQFHEACSAAEEESNTSAAVCCPMCNSRQPGIKEEAQEEDEAEFASKCPKVAESYTKLQEYINNHKDVDSILEEREKLKAELVVKNQELYSEKDKLELQVTELSKKLLVIEEAKNMLRLEEEKKLQQIQKIQDFIILFQKTNKKEEKNNVKVDINEVIEEGLDIEVLHSEEDEAVEEMIDETEQQDETHEVEEESFDAGTGGEATSPRTEDSLYDVHGGHEEEQEQVEESFQD